MNSLFLLGILALVIFIFLIYIFRKNKTILFVLFLLAAVAAWTGYSQYTRTNKDLTNVKADKKVTAAELVKEYENNDSAANKNYLGKIVEVTGTVKEVTKDETGFYTVALGEEGNLSSVRCSMDSSHKDDAAKLAVRSSATIRGECIGFEADVMGLGADVKLSRAVIVKNEK